MLHRKSSRIGQSYLHGMLISVAVNVYEYMLHPTNMANISTQLFPRQPVSGIFPGF